METQKPKTESEEAPKRRRGRPRKSEGATVVEASLQTKESKKESEGPSTGKADDKKGEKRASTRQPARAKKATSDSKSAEFKEKPEKPENKPKRGRPKKLADSVETEVPATVPVAVPAVDRPKSDRSAVVAAPSTADAVDSASEASTPKPAATPEGDAGKARADRPMRRKRTTYVNTMTGMVKMDQNGALDLEAQQKSREDMELDRLREKHPEYFVVDEPATAFPAPDAAIVPHFEPVIDASEEVPMRGDSEEEPASEKEHNGLPVQGILEFSDQVPPYGFLRQEGVSSDNDIYVSPMFIRKFNLKPGELVKGYSKRESGGERYKALVYVSEVNGVPPFVHRSKMKFDEMTPLFPKQRFRLEGDSNDKAMRILDLIAPIGKGQRGLIVAPPKSGKTILLQKIARAIKENYPDVELMILLIDERPEEVTDMKEFVDAPVFYSTFDELPTNHIRIAELVLNRARGLVELGKDVVILLDSITRLARAYNIALPSSGRTLSGGLDTSALHRPKRFLGSARNTKEGGSLTILATALIETGSRMDDVIFEEFKGTGNMELILDRKLSERRIFPSIDIKRSGTRREELLLSDEEYEAILKVRRVLDKYPGNEPAEKLINDIVATKNNAELISLINKKL
ncbi:MAG: transcription termination factor Rho [Bacillota bacterium]|nr:transcription termination factor Rho [Bacillota bacterium]